MTTGIAKSKMCFALRGFYRINPWHKDRIKLTGRQYEFIRRLANGRTALCGRKNGFYRKKHTKATKAIMSNKRKERHALGVKEGMSGKTHGPYARMMASVTVIKHNPGKETRFGVGHTPWNKGKKNYHHNRPAPKVRCPNCGLIGSSHAMRRWHFSNCKHERRSEPCL
jgi:hypothetical protein